MKLSKNAVVGSYDYYRNAFLMESQSGHVEVRTIGRIKIGLILAKGALLGIILCLFLSYFSVIPWYGIIGVMVVYAVLLVEIGGRIGVMLLTKDESFRKIINESGKDYSNSNVQE